MTVVWRGEDRCLRRWVDVTRAQMQAAVDPEGGGGRKESRRARYVAVPVNNIERHGLAPASQFFDNGQGRQGSVAGMRRASTPRKGEGGRQGSGQCQPAPNASLPPPEL